MASTTSEGYCNHLRGQLKEWERAFRSRNGRFPKQRDFEALDSDASARGRLVHAAYLALNRATGDSFTKSLATRESTRNMVIIGGPRQSAAERNNGGALGSAQSFRQSSSRSGSGNSNNGRNRPGAEGGDGGGGSGGGKHSSGGPIKSNSISQHLDIMERLRAKVQPRSGSSLAAPLAQGKSGQQRPKVNSVLAAGDGRRRSGRGAVATSKNRLDRSSNGAAGVHVSSRARAMGMSATATKEPEGAAAVTKPERNASSLALGENSKGGVPRLRDSSRSVEGAGCGGVSPERRGGVGGGRSALARASSSRGAAGVHAANGERRESVGKDLAAAAETMPPYSTGSRARECAGGVGTLDAGKPDGGANGDSGGATASGSSSRSTSTSSSAFNDDGQEGPQEDGAPPDAERELTPERRATRRVGGAVRGGRSAVPGASRSNGLRSFRADFGRGVVAKKSRATGERLGGKVFSSASANACSDGVAGPGRRGKGSATAPATAAAGDEAGLAVAMMDILQSSGSMLSANTTPSGATRVGDGSQDRLGDTVAAAAAASGLLPTAASIVNTVGGSGGGAGVAFGGSSLPHSSGGLGAPGMVGAKKRRPAAVVAKAAGSTAEGAATICGPGLVASSCSSGPRRTGGGGGGGSGVEEDWRLRASRAVGRVREEEEAGDAASLAAVAAAAAATAAKAAGAVADGGGPEGTHGGRSPTPTSTTPQGPQGSRVTGSGNAISTAGREAIVTGNKQTSGTPALGAGRISDSDEDGGGDDSDWSLGGGGGTSASSTTRQGKTGATAYVRDHEGDPASDRARRASAAGAQPVPGRVPSSRAVGGRKKAKPAKKTTEVSDNFVRADLKSRGSSRFKRKGSGRSKARGGSGGRSFGGGGRGGGGRWGGRGFGGRGGGFRDGSSKWGSGSKGREDPVTGEKGGAPRDRPLSCGAAKNRAGLDVLDQCLDALAVVTGGDAGGGGGGGGGGGCDEQGNSRPFERPRNAREEEELFLRLAPRCPQHQRAGKLLTVRKTGLNKGRKFYACSLPRGEGCDFFMWAEDNPALVLSELTLQETGEEWRQRKNALLSKSLAKLPISELKKELKKRRLGCGGKKDALVARLVDHAASELESSTTSCVLVTPAPEKENVKPSTRKRDGTSSSCRTALAVRAHAKRDDDSGGHSNGRREGESSSSGSGGGSSGGEDDDDDDGDSDFEFAFAEGVKPAAFPATAPAGAVSELETAGRAAGAGACSLSRLPVPETDGEDHSTTAAEKHGGGGGGGSAKSGGSDGGGEDTGGTPGAVDPAASVTDCSGIEGNGGVDGTSEVVGTVVLSEGRGRKRPLDAVREDAEDRGDADEDEEGGVRGEDEEEPAWASLVESDDEEEEREEEEEEEEEGEEEGGSSSGTESAEEEGGGDPDDDSAWSEEEERADRANRRRRLERIKRRKLGDGGVSRRQRVGSGRTKPAATAIGRKKSGGGGSSCSSSSNSDDDSDDNDDDDAEERPEPRRRRKARTGSANSDDDDDDGGGSDLPLTPASALRRVFGHKAFREGQEWGVARAMGGQASLLVLATGTGKSLTYQLPALLLPGITVVVSPLVSLMEDQMANLPPQLPGASLSGSHGGLREVAGTVRDLKAGRVKVLFLSPEKLCSPSFRRLASTPGALPPVSLLCVDEAHCVSQWSHNFRPSYLRLGQTLDLLRPRGVLALTATASKAVVEDICTTLRIPRKDGVKVGSWDRPNLDVRVLRSAADDDKRSRLSRLLQEAPLDKGSVVVYVWRQVTAEAVCALLQGDGHNAVAYHGGMEAGARQRAQNAFMRGRSRVVVATVAFGLGVDMRDIRGVVHFDMPKSIENYVQEIGRAGRDGRSARCCLLLCHKDFVTHHSLSHSKGLELVQVRGLMRSIMADAPQGILGDTAKKKPSGPRDQYDDDKDDAAGGGDEAAGLQKALSVVDLESRLDVGGEVVETVLSVLEGEPYRLLKLHAVMDDHLVVHFRKRRPSLLAEGEPAIGLLLALGTVEGLPSSGKGYSYGHGSAKVSLVRLAEALGWAPTAVVRELRRLQFMGEVEYSLSQRSFHVTLLRGLSSRELEQVCLDLHRTLSMAEASEAQKVEAVYLALAAEAVVGEGDGGQDDPGSSSSSLSSPPRKSSGKKRARGDGETVTTAAAVGGSGGGGDSGSGGDGRDTPAAKARARSVLHATISRYFDEGCGGGNKHVNNGGSPGLASGGGSSAGPADPSSAIVDGGPRPSAEEATEAAVEALPHRPLDKRACEVLVRDASVLVTDPSFLGRLNTGFDDYGSGGGGGGGGLGFFDVATGGTAAAAGGAGIGMAPHSWLLKDVPMLARAVARVFHGIGSVSFPATKWRDSAFWARYRHHSFREVKSKLEIAFGARRL